MPAFSPALTRLVLVATLALLAACTKPVVFADEEVVRAAVYRAPPPTEIVLFNVISNSGGSGEHSALLVSGSQRVLFDPAGTFQHVAAPERNDVHFGMTDRMVSIYTYFHARQTHHVRTQTLRVSPEVAEQILQLVIAYGPVPDAQCARSISSILSQVPGFEEIRVVWRPNALSDQFARIPGVIENRIYADTLPGQVPQIPS